MLQKILNEQLNQLFSYLIGLLANYLFDYLNYTISMYFKTIDWNKNHLFLKEYIFKIFMLIIHYS